MAASKGFTGKGTVLSIGVAGSPETFVAIAQLKTLQLSGQKISFDDVTNLDSPQLGGGVLEESIPAKASPGELAMAGIFVPTDSGQKDIEAAFSAGTLTDFTVQLPKGPGQTATGNLYAFSGYVQDLLVPDIQFDKTLTFKTTVKLNTVITKTLGT
jgi:hypothetical protein